jgi:protoporphyrin/coproporphyrin ferrochelatase
MKTGILVVNFGEPAEPTLARVTPFLQRIFYANASLEGQASEEARRARSRELAARRAPALVEEYEAIGGSPLNQQATGQARALGLVLDRRGYGVHVYSAFQFTDPLVADVVREARADGIERLFALPVYPLAGPSTNVAALNDVQAALDALRWKVPFEGVTGWHRHPLYLELRADALRRTAAEGGVDLGDPRSRLVFSAHGTPKKYLDAGSRYQEYVEEFCREIATMVGVGDYVIGYQNHSNRGIEWTQPDVDEVIREVDADAVVVDPVSFMHEQSETLAELDHELRGDAEARGLAFHRVPIPHDDPRFAEVLADLAEPFLTGAERKAAGLRFARCRCRPEANTFCLNALPREEATTGSPAEAPAR